MSHLFQIPENNNSHCHHWELLESLSEAQYFRCIFFFSHLECNFFTPLACKEAYKKVLSTPYVLMGRHYMLLLVMCNVLMEAIHALTVIYSLVKF